MERVKFNPNEFTGEFTEDRFGKAPVFHSPITPKENYIAMFNGENPLWFPMTSDCKGIDIKIDPDNIARAFVFEYEPFDNVSDLGLRPDMFGVNWVYVPTAGGSMVPGGTPLLEDANEWKEKVVFPDVNSWDWEGSAKANAPWFEQYKDYVTNITFLNGTTFERLISFMDFMGAAMAIIDDDQVEAVKELCDAICEKVYFPYLENCKKWFPNLDKVTLHDDWGSQASPFFSLTVAREVFVPVMKKFTDKCKELGFLVELHSCGHTEMNVPAYIEAGFQTWNGMPMNDKRALFEKYGDQFIFGVDAPDISADMNASDEDLYAAAKEFCEFYIRDGKCHAVANCSRKNPKFVEYVYEISRKMLNP